MTDKPTPMMEEDGIEVIAADLSVAWGKYVNLFDDCPHGTEKQLTALLELTIKTKNLIQEVRRLRLLIRCETIKPPHEVTDDLTTELAVENSFLSAENERLKEGLKELTIYYQNIDRVYGVYVSQRLSKLLEGK